MKLTKALEELSKKVEKGKLRSVSVSITTYGGKPKENKEVEITWNVYVGDTMGGNLSADFPTFKEALADLERIIKLPRKRKGQDCEI